MILSLKNVPDIFIAFFAASMVAISFYDIKIYFIKIIFKFIKISFMIFLFLIKFTIKTFFFLKKKKN